MDDIEKYKILDQNELDDTEWTFSLIIVSTNRERLDISEIQAKRYAKHHKTHMIRWQLDIIEWKGKPKRWQQALHVDPVKGRLANGSKAKCHSLTYVDEEQYYFLMEQMNSVPYGEN
eukprot:13374676-Ditylum_brightwellii.AAC.1